MRDQQWNSDEKTTNIHGLTYTPMYLFYQSFPQREKKNHKSKPVSSIG